MLTDLFTSKNNRTLAKVMCVHCGRETIVRPDSLMHGKTTSCVCANKKHGEVGTRLYGIWGNMKYRCNNSNAQEYYNYGGKGVSVCDDWNQYENFRDWAISNGYKDNLTIDRINSDGDYCPENCRWITKSENTSRANKGKQHRKPVGGTYFGISPDGKYYEFANANQFSAEHNLNPGCVRKCANGGLHSYREWNFGFVNNIDSQKPQSTIESIAE